MRNNEQYERFLGLCFALAAERDREALLSRILDTAIEIASCDAGTLYLLEDDGLHFCRMVTRSQQIRQGGHADPITLPPVPLDPTDVASWVAIHNETICVEDMRHETRFDFSGSMRYDELTGYRTRSMMVTPMCNDQGELIGVMQLINALDADGEIIPFDPDIQLLVNAMSAQAAISITNMQYAEQIVQLLDSLVGALSAAIDERTPYNANHTRNMVRYAEAFLDYLDRTNNALRFSAAKRSAFLLAIWLHDVGKLVVPLEVMDKSTRLGAHWQELQERLRVIGLLDRLAFLEGSLSEGELTERNRLRADALALAERLNGTAFVTDQDLEDLEALAALRYRDENGRTLPWLTEEEKNCLAVRKGTLTSAERTVMESHVTVTAHILQHVVFPKNYAQVPHWAAAHHELLNGKGYPAHLTAPDLPMEVRLLTILDVFEALTARDRPYKEPMPPERALTILREMADAGAIDRALLSLFADSHAWLR